MSRTVFSLVSNVHKINIEIHKQKLIGATLGSIISSAFYYNEF